MDKERVDTWRQAQALRRKWSTATTIKSEKMSVGELDKWWAKQQEAQQFSGTPGKSHRLFVLSGETWSRETGETPWADEPDTTTSLDAALDWMLQRQGPCDTILVFDGRSSSIREKMHTKMKGARNSTDVWIVYQPRREGGGRKTVFGSRNREVGWISFPVSKTRVATQERSGKAAEKQPRVAPGRRRHTRPRFRAWSL